MGGFWGFDLVSSVYWAVFRVLLNSCSGGVSFLSGGFPGLLSGYQGVPSSFYDIPNCYFGVLCWVVGRALLKFCWYVLCGC